MLPAAWPGGYRRVVLPEVDSTLNEAARQFEAHSAPTWIMAHVQTKGRGRRGRSWMQPVGNFAGTLVLPLAEAPERMALRSFVASLAVFDTLVSLTGRSEPLGLKWPNDVLLNGGKAAGILLETLSRKGRAAGVAIGIGVNLADAPSADQVEERALRPVAVSHETGIRISPEDFLDSLAQHYAAHEVSFRTFGFRSIRKAWLHRAAYLGNELTARFGNQSITGRFETVDETGRLILENDQGRHAIAAADVYF